MKRTLRKIFAFASVTAALLAVICITAAAESGTNATESTFFGEIFGAVKAHSSEIFSALTLVGSCALAFSYKNGLLPTIRKSIGGIGNAVSEIRTSSSETAEAAGTLSETVNGKLLVLEEALSSLGRSIGAVEEKLSSLEKDDLHRAKADAVINEQVSLLYDVFMFSSMPEYQKEAVGRRVEKMRGMIAVKSCESDEEQNEN